MRRAELAAAVLAAVVLAAFATVAFAAALVAAPHHPYRPEPQWLVNCAPTADCGATP